jgi:thioredoxin-related protein
LQKEKGAMRKRSLLRGRLLSLALLLSVGMLGAVRESRTGGDVTWADSYAAGLAQARQTGKPLMLSFHMPGCGWCQKLDAETFTDPRVVALLRQFVCVRLDSDVDSAAIQSYQVQEFPTTVFADARGREQTRFTGYIAPDRFAPALRLLLAGGEAGRIAGAASEHGPALALRRPAAVPPYPRNEPPIPW